MKITTYMVDGVLPVPSMKTKVNKLTSEIDRVTKL